MTDHDLSIAWPLTPAQVAAGAAALGPSEFGNFEQNVLDIIWAIVDLDRLATPPPPFDPSAEAERMARLRRTIDDLKTSSAPKEPA